MARASLVIFAALGLIACGLRPSEKPPLAIEYGGCAYVRGPAAEPTCVLTAERTLAVWLKSVLGADLEIIAGDQAWGPADAEPVEAGYRFILTRLEARRLVARAERDGAVTELSIALEPPGDSAEDGVLLSNSARRSWAEGEVQRAREEAERAVELHGQSGNLSYMVYDLTFLHSLLFYRFEDVEGARDVLFRQMPEIASGDGDSRFLVAFNHGQWAINTGDVRAALAELGTASRQAERLGQARNRNMARQLLARQLRRLGRHEEAAELWSSLVEEIGQLRGDCEKAQLLNNFAWDRLLALEARVSFEIPVPELEKALDLAEGCVTSAEEINMRLNLALAHLHAGHPGNARRELDRAQAAGEPGRRLLAWLYDVQGRIALAEGRGAAALAAYEALEKLASARPGVAWRAAVGRARALEATGKLEAALEELGKAEALLDEESRQAPVDSGRETSVAARQWGTELYLDLLVSRGRLADALEVARGARSRLFRGLSRDARRLDLDTAERARWSLLVGRYNLLRGRLEEEESEDWAVPAEQNQALAAQREAQRRELGALLDEALALLDGSSPGDGGAPPAVAPGEVLLVYHPAPRGWFAFAADELTVDVHRAEILDVFRSSDAELAEQLLEPFAERLRQGNRVRVLPYGELRAVDFHALPFDGEVLLSTAAVVYGLDLSPAAPRPGRRALLIADPSGSLPAAQKEVADVERALARQDGWNVEIFDAEAVSGDAEIRSAATVLRELLPAVDLLHFAGHADLVGHNWESGLVFDRDRVTRLTIGDILTRPAVPAAVMLSACETAQASVSQAPVGLGVAHAFLLAGGRVAIGAVRPVDDRTTAALVRHFYSSWDGAPASAATALAAAQLALRREAPAADWASFRILER